MPNVLAHTIFSLAYVSVLLVYHCLQDMIKPTVATSTTEVEFIATGDTGDGGKMVLCVQSILFDLGIPYSTQCCIHHV